MTRIAYLDCFSGISGDMLLGALVDAGVEAGALSAELAKLGVPGWSLRTEAVRRAGIAATRVHVVLAEEAQPHRRLPDVLAIIDRSSLAATDRERAATVFRLLAQAEARVHGVAEEQIDFHEVGALDAIVDVVGGVAGLRMLGVERLYCSALPAGGGTARSAHGALPVPAPATLLLMAMAGAPLASSAGDRPMELVTPTGAAIVTALAAFERPAMRMAGVGHGAGGRDPEGWPNVLRLWLGDAIEPARPAMLLIETNIDDMNPEIYGYVQERLFAAGAADVWYQPIQMKKNRPGVLLSVLCPADREHAIAALLLRETSTLGVRVSTVGRHEAQREAFEFTSSLGPAAVKVKRLPGEPPRVAPEYEACRRIAESSGLALAEVYRTIEREALDQLRGGA
ncbi:MAG TPA: nickel pincer cofactor biosynthesis protein LarC [Dehalococcoidia bacterium]|nr:nickel pincer cofactor biosynthesis protein LarC [Dehalococcoidia bacterium]